MVRIFRLMLVFIYIYIYIYMYACVCIYMYMYVHIYIYIKQDQHQTKYIYIYINSTNIPRITIINGIYETEYILSLQLVSFLVGLRTYQHPCTQTLRSVTDTRNFHILNKMSVFMRLFQSLLFVRFLFLCEMLFLMQIRNYAQLKIYVRPFIKR